MIYEKEYAGRRKKLAKKLCSNSIMIVYSAEQKIRSNDTEFPYRQDSNFYYLTGFKEDNSALVIIKEKKEFKSYLFVAKKDPSLELWTGKRLGQEKAKKSFLVDDVFLYEDLGKKLSNFVAKKYALYYDFKLDYSKVKLIKSKTKNIPAYLNIAILIEEMRLIKSASEIKLIKKALTITKEAHHKAMKISSSLKYEYELQAEFEYIFKKNGAYSDAYTTIVACGNSANTLHYIANDKRLIKNELILIDAGCEYEYYASDITRTIAVSGEFSSAQKEVYNMVLDVNKKIIKMIKPNILKSELQKKSEELLCKGMLRLGILYGEFQELLDEKIYKKYYPHGIGHWMGLDVHDQCPYKTISDDEIPLKAGMVMTIEPGIYLEKEDKSIPKKYRGIGIRIEDNILVTKDGYENLSSDIIKDVDEMQEFIRKNSSSQ